MNDIEKLEARITASEAALIATQHALTVDRKLSHDKHPSGHFTTALNELDIVVSGLKTLKIRFETVGR